MAVSVAIFSAVFVVFLGATLRWGMKCDEGCEFAPGYAWTRYEDSWQWHAQFAVAWAALAMAGTAVHLTGRSSYKRAVVAVLAAILLIAAWIGWYSETPLYA